MTSEPLRILVVEADRFAAERLAQEIRAGGDLVVGPFDDDLDAIHQTDGVQGAILNFGVPTEIPFELADSLVHHGIPFVFLADHGHSAVPARFARHHLYARRSHAAPLLHDLHQQHLALCPDECDSIETVVMKLRRRSRRLMPDEASADRLVEAALQRAIAEADRARHDDDRAARLRILLEEEYHRSARSHLH